MEPAALTLEVSGSWARAPLVLRVRARGSRRQGRLQCRPARQASVTQKETHLADCCVAMHVSHRGRHRNQHLPVISGESIVAPTGSEMMTDFRQVLFATRTLV